MINSKIIYGVLFVFCIPLVVLIVFSFVSSVNDKTFELSINGYIELTKSVRIEEVLKITLRSFIVCSTSTLISYIISYLLVLYTNNKIQIFFMIAITLPFLANEAVRIFSWQHILAFNGVINGILTYIGFDKLAIFNSSNNLNIYITMVVATIPFAIFIFVANFKIIPKVYLRVSDDLKIGHLSKFIRIILPMSRFAIFTSLIITFFIAFSLSSEVNFLGGSTKISTRGFITSLMSANRFDAIFSFGTVILFIIISCFFIGYLYMKKYKIIKDK